MKKQKQNHTKRRFWPILILLLLLGAVAAFYSLRQTAQVAMIISDDRGRQSLCSFEISSLQVSGSCESGFTTYRYTCQSQRDKSIKFFEQGCLDFEAAYAKIENECRQLCATPTPTISSTSMPAPSLQPESPLPSVKPTAIATTKPVVNTKPRPTLLPSPSLVPSVTPTPTPTPSFSPSPTFKPFTFRQPFSYFRCVIQAMQSGQNFGQARKSCR